MLDVRRFTFISACLLGAAALFGGCDSGSSGSDPPGAVGAISPIMVETFFVSQDTFISAENSGTNNNGGSLRLSGGEAGAGELRVLIQFDITESCPCDVSQARATSPNVGGPGENSTDDLLYTAHLITEEWDDGDVTWDTQPTFDAESIGEGTIFGATGTLDFTIDLEAAADWLRGDVENFGVILLPDPDGVGSKVFESLETGVPGPELLLNFFIPEDEKKGPKK